MTAHARAVFAVVLLALLALAATSLLVRSSSPTRARSRRSRWPAALRPAGRRLRPGFNGLIPIVDVNDDPEAPQRIYQGVGLRSVASAREPQFNDEKTVAIVFVTPDLAPQDEATDKLVDRPPGKRRARGHPGR